MNLNLIKWMSSILSHYLTFDASQVNIVWNEQLNKLKLYTMPRLLLDKNNVKIVKMVKT